MYSGGYRSVRRRVYRRNKKITGIIKGGIIRKSTSKNQEVLFTLPRTVSYILITSKQYTCLRIYDKNYYFNYMLNPASILSIKFYTDVNSLNIVFNKHYPFLKFGVATIYRFLHVFYTLFFGRLHVFGRLYRIYKRNIYRDLQFRFGNAHEISVYVDGIYLKYVRKKQIRFIGYDPILIRLKLNEAALVFPHNIYTERGIYLDNQP